MAQIFISHQPVISRQGKIIASRLRLHANAADAKAMPHVVAALRAIEEYWPTGQHGFFLGLNDAPVTPAIFDWMLPENATIEIPAPSLRGEDGALLRRAVQDNGASLCVGFDAQLGQGTGEGITGRFLGFDGRTITPVQMRAMAVKLKACGIPIAVGVDSPETFKASVDAGIHAVAGWFCKHAVKPTGKALAPNQAHIVRLLNLVRNDADVAQIETALKQDVALSYKLLRYINSAGFGLSCEIQSFRHAVTMLGYNKLHKWLSLLLVTAGKDAMAPMLMHASLIRARFMELLGVGLVDKSEGDNLFITGAFSLLDHLLGVSLETALGEMHLPESISEALLTRIGLYAPFYHLALACENDDGAEIEEIAGSLGLDAQQVNAALLQALAFAATMTA